MVHLLSSAMESSPSCSPGEKRDRDVKEFAKRVEPKYFVLEPEESDEAGDDLMHSIVVLLVREKSG